MSRFAWCETNAHDRCRHTYLSNGHERRCDCPCHDTKDKP